jgi:cyclophilin family peptidyl-prolyl cis-trans isomerase/protein-disulfide isomerase
MQKQSFCILFCFLKGTMKRVNLLFFLVSVFILGACALKTETPQPTAVLAKPVIVDTPTLTFAASCSSINTQPTLIPNDDSYFPPVSQADFTFGPVDAPVTIVEYCDFQSDGCRNMATIVAELMRNHDDLRLVFRPLPLIGVLDKSDKAILAALAADEQGKFWEMYDLLFVKNDEWKNLSPDIFNPWVKRESVKAGMDGEKLQASIAANSTAARMQSMYDTAKKLSIPSVPLILINGTLQPSYLLDYQSMSDAIGLIALGKKQFTQCPSFSVNPQKQYIATLHTEKGDIIIQLFADKAPLAVNSFVFLAREGWFNGVTFHRVIPGFIAQTGDPSGTGSGNPGYFFKNEISDLKFDKPGMVGMANNGADTNGSQFFITYAPADHLNGNYTAFGQVLSGLDVVENLTPRDPSQGVTLPSGDKILKVDIEEK